MDKEREYLFLMIMLGIINNTLMVVKPTIDYIAFVIMYSASLSSFCYCVMKWSALRSMRKKKPNTSQPS